MASYKLLATGFANYKAGSFSPPPKQDDHSVPSLPNLGSTLRPSSPYTQPKKALQPIFFTMKSVPYMLWLCVAIASAYPTRDDTVNIAASPVSAEAQPAQTIAPVPEDWPIKCATDPCYTACTGWAEFFSMGGGCSKYHYISCLVSQAFSLFLFVSFVSLLIKLITQKNTTLLGTCHEAHRHCYYWEEN